MSNFFSSTKVMIACVVFAGGVQFSLATGFFPRWTSAQSQLETTEQKA